MICLLSTLAPLLLPCQEPEEAAPLPPHVFAILDEQTISQQEYLDFLYLRFGKRAADDFLAHFLLEKEAKAYGIEIAESEVENIAKEREKASRDRPRQGSFEDEVKQNGQDLEMFRASLRAGIHRELITDALVLATRVVTDAKLHQSFEMKYGKEGQRFRVRHIVLMPNILRAEAIRGGQPATSIDMDQLKANAKSQAEGLLTQLKEGADFQELAATHSHDRVTRERGGELLNYNGQLYGVEFFSAIQTLNPEELSGVIETGAGYHIVQLISKEVTQLDAVREILSKEIMDAEPSWQERSGLLQALRGKAKIQLW